MMAKSLRIQNLKQDIAINGYLKGSPTLTREPEAILQKQQILGKGQQATKRKTT